MVGYDWRQFIVLAGSKCDQIGAAQEKMLSKSVRRPTCFRRRGLQRGDPGDQAMTIPKIRAPVSRIVALCLALAGGIVANQAAAASPDPETSVRSFYDALLRTMKNGPALGQSGRYAALAPIVHVVFDVPLMTRLAVGPYWATLTPARQQQLIDAFGRYVSATYAYRFDSYAGQRLEVTGDQPYGGRVIVNTRIVESGNDPVMINYLMQQNGDSWQISDIYLDGTISQLATQRSEFQSILQRKGVDGLIAALNRKVDLLTGNTVE
jgi:phospholipid transport system substrate-binding protein